MTLDELMLQYTKAASDVAFLQYEGPDHRAGLKAVVEALRDEVAAIEGWSGAKERIDEVFKKILASDGVGKAAGKDTAVKSEAIERSAPAAAPVCEWTDGGEHWETSCGDRTFHWSSVQGKIVCHLCGKLIEFKDTSK